MGDTHSDVLESTIKHLPPKVLKNLDLVKISHHGSKYNNGLSLYNLLSSKILNNNRWQSTWSSASRDISKNYKK